MLSFKARFLFSNKSRPHEAVPPKFRVHVWMEEFRRVGTGREGIKKRTKSSTRTIYPGMRVGQFTLDKRRK